MNDEVMNLNVKIRLFAGLAERTGQSILELTVPDATTVRDLKQRVADEVPQIAPLLSQTVVAVNRQYTDDDQTVNASDEIALIPPVSGGSPENDTDDSPACQISEHALDISDAYRQLEDANCGGTVLFSGTVREWTRGRKSLYLDYEAYTDMALVQMRRIQSEVEADWPGVKTLQWHRVGRLLPTDIAVICAAASPHREAAFTAAKTLIDRLKKEVPIWKKETYADGETTWQATP